MSGKREADDGDDNPAPLKRARTRKRPVRNFVREEKELKAAVREKKSELQRRMSIAKRTTVAALRDTHGARPVGQIASERWVKQQKQKVIDDRKAARVDYNRTSAKLDRLYMAWSRAVVQWMSEEKLEPVVSDSTYHKACGRRRPPKNHALELVTGSGGKCLIKSYVFRPRDGVQGKQHALRRFFVSFHGDNDAVIMLQVGRLLLSNHKTWYVANDVRGVSIPRRWYLWVGDTDLRERARKLLDGGDSVFKDLPKPIKDTIVKMVRESL
jgi:hypothetical protein